MALPADFSKIYGSTATGGLTPINDVNYAKGWEFVGANPPTKNDFSYLQNLSDQKSQWLYSNKLQRTDPFGDIKSDGAAAISKAITNLGLGAGAPPIGIPFFWPTSSMPNTVMPEWSDMVFLKLNDATFSATTYPKLALVWPGLKLTDTRGEFIRIFDDGRGVDSGRTLLSAQGDAMQRMTGSLGDVVYRSGYEAANITGAFYGVGGPSGLVSPGADQVALRTITVSFDTQNAARTASETRSRNIAFNFLVRAK